MRTRISVLSTKKRGKRKGGEHACSFVKGEQFNVRNSEGRARTCSIAHLGLVERSFFSSFLPDVRLQRITGDE